MNQNPGTRIICTFVRFNCAKVLQARYRKYQLHFKTPGGTSRGVLYEKETFFIILQEAQNFGIGECAVFRGLSADDVPAYEATLQWVCTHIHLGLPELLLQLEAFPSIQFGLEQAFVSLKSTHPFLLFPSEFTRGAASIPINGLVWMGDVDFMKAQIKTKIASGFTTIKLKIGALDFASELDIIRSIRKEYSEKDIALRVDANGAFHPDEALEKLKYLSDFHIHSIEQPIKAGQWEAMAKLCRKTPLPIALDEELIGAFRKEAKAKILSRIQPQYIILKPSLIGGFQGSEQWIQLAGKHGTGWWITSALESNIGLNAIAQFTYQLQVNIPQGLGTGSLFTNNMESPLSVVNGQLKYDPNMHWNVNVENL